MKEDEAGPAAAPSQVTRVLERIADGDDSAQAELVELVHGTLTLIAQRDE